MVLSDDSIHSDMESQMFKYSDHTPSYSFKSNKKFFETDKSRPSLFVNFVLKRTRNLKYNLGAAFLSGLKIIVTIAAMSDSPKACPDVLNYWLIAMASYDFINVISRFMLIKLLIPKKRKGPATEALIPSEKEECINEAKLSDGKVILVNELDAIAELHERKEDKAVQVVALCRFFYFGILIWGQIILYKYLPGCNQMLNLRTTLFYIFIGFGYIYVGIPLLIFLIDLMCAGFGALKAWVTEKLQKRAAARAARTMSVVGDRMLIYRKFTANLTGPQKCGICVNAYSEDENIIQLQCNIDHHFHDQCLTNWMMHDNSCPLCQRTISYTKDDHEDLTARSSVASIFTA